MRISTSRSVRRGAVALAVLVGVAAGTVLGDRHLPFRGSGTSYSDRCGAILSGVDTGFLPQSTLAGRQIISEWFEEKTQERAYRFDCVLYGDGDRKFTARAGLTTATLAGWRKDIKDRGIVAGAARRLDVTDNSPHATTTTAGIEALSGDASAAFFVPCELPGADAHLAIAVRAPGASDGNSDSQRLAIAAVASRLAEHAVLEVGCRQPRSVPDDSPEFAERTGN